MGRTNETSPRRVGRCVGLLFLIQVLCAVPVYTRAGMMAPVMRSDFLASAAGSALQVRAAVLLLSALGALTLAMGLVAYPVFRRRSDRMALLYVGLGVLGLATQAAEAVAIRGMVSLSLQYVKPGAPRALVETMGAAARSTWLSAHFTNLLVGHLTVLTLVLVLYRFALVPRLLAGVAIASSLVAVVGVTLPLLGRPFSYLMVAPTGATMLVLTVWLVVRGFAEWRPSPRAAGRLSTQPAQAAPPPPPSPTTGSEP